jgi:hypothetical protein
MQTIVLKLKRDNDLKFALLIATGSYIGVDGFIESLYFRIRKSNIFLSNFQRGILESF